MTYLKVEEANELIKQIYTSKSKEYVLWNTLTDEDKQVLLNIGSDAVENCLYRGKKIHNAAFPRYIDHVYFEAPPEAVLKAIIAIGVKNEMQANSKEMQLKELGVSSYKVADAAISFGTNSNGSINTNTISGIYKDIYNKYLRKYCY